MTNIKALCLVCESERGKGLTRLADIVYNRMQYFYQDKGQPATFDNRGWWFLHDQSFPTGKLGVWNLTAIPNSNDPLKDYIRADYSPEEIPVEVLELKEANNCQDIIRRINTSIDYALASKNVFVCYKPTRDTYQGILLYEKNIIINNDNTSFKFDKNSANILNVYEINANNILTFKALSGKSFFSNFNMGEPTHKIYSKPEPEIIRDIILNRATWPIMRQNGFTKNEWKRIREFFSNIMDNDLFIEIGKNCFCNEETAKLKVNRFINNCDDFINGNDFDTATIASILSRNLKLKQQCMEQAATFWENENKEKTQQAKQELLKLQADADTILDKAHKDAEEIKNKALNEADIIKNKAVLDAKAKIKELDYDKIKNEVEKAKNQISFLTTEKANISAEISKSNQDLKNLKATIAKNSNLDEDIKLKIVNKLNEAKKDVASFLGEYSFISQILTPCSSANGSNAVSQVQNSKCLFYTKNVEIMEETVNNWQEQLNCLEENLNVAGVEDSILHSFAAFLLAAYSNNNHLLLTGPNNESIACALSCAMTGKTIGILDCSGEIDFNSINNMINSENEVILIKNPFASEWLEKIIDLINQNQKYYILSSSFAEDLILEAKGLYNYVIPVLTELLVSNQANNCYIYVNRSNTFKSYEICNPMPLQITLLKELGMNRMLQNTYQTIITALHKLIDNNDVLAEYLYLLMPYAFAVNKKETISDKIKTESRINNIYKNDILRFLDTLDE